MSDPYLTIKQSLTIMQAAAVLGVRPPAVRKLIEAGAISASDISLTPGVGRARWRITESALAEFLDSRAYRPDPPRRRRRRKKEKATKEYF